MFGLDVKIYTVGSRAINGMVHTGRNELYLNRNSLADPKRTFWHEVFHILKANNYKLFTDLKDSLRVSDKTINEYRNSRADLKNEDNDFVLEEILADNMANSAERLNMFRKLSGLEDRSVIQRFVDYVKDMMDKFIELFHNPTGRLTTAQRNQMRAVLGKMADSLVDANGNKIFKVSADGKRITAVDGEYNKQGKWRNSATTIEENGHGEVIFTLDEENIPQREMYSNDAAWKSDLIKWAANEVKKAVDGKTPKYRAAQLIDMLPSNNKETIDRHIKEKGLNATLDDFVLRKNSLLGGGLTSVEQREGESYNDAVIRTVKYRAYSAALLEGAIRYARYKGGLDPTVSGRNLNSTAGRNVGGRNSVSSVQEPSKGLFSTATDWLARKLNHGYDVDNPNASGIKKRELKPDRNQMYLL